MKQRLDWLASVAVLASAWAGAFAWVAAARMFANLYREFGSDLPGPTDRVIWLAQQQAPFGIAVVCTLVIAWQNVIHFFEVKHSGLTSSVLSIPEYPFITPTAIAFATASLILFVRLLESISETFGK